MRIILKADSLQLAEEKLHFIRGCLSKSYQIDFFREFQGDLDGINHAFLCSFPRSGNSWTRRLLLNYCFFSNGEIKEKFEKVLIHDEKKKVNAPGFKINGEVYKLDNLFSETNIMLSQGGLKKTDGVDHAGVSELNLPILIIKTHQFFDNHESKTVYLKRERLASIISYYRLIFREIEDDLVEKEHFNFYVRKIAEIEEEFGEMIDNRSNREASLVVNYEDLVGNTWDAMKEIIEYLELELDEEALQRTLQAVPPFISKKKEKFASLLTRKNLDFIQGKTVAFS